MNKYVLTTCFIFLSGFTHAVEVDLFVNDRSEIVEIKSTGIDLRVHDLSAPEKIKKEYLPQKLSPNPEIAKQQAIDFFKSERGNEYKQKVLAANEHKALLIKYNLQKAPALVFDGKAVIYGITDIDRGLILYRQYLENNHEK